MKPQLHSILPNLTDGIMPTTLQIFLGSLSNQT